MHMIMIPGWKSNMSYEICIAMKLENTMRPNSEGPAKEFRFTLEELSKTFNNPGNGMLRSVWES